MQVVTNAISIAMVAAGLGFIAAATVGLFRLPDVYTKGHAVSKAETVGLLLIFGGMFFHPDMSFAAAVRMVFVLGFALVANPTAVHAITRAARKAHVVPWSATPGPPGAKGPEATPPPRPEAET